MFDKEREVDILGLVVVENVESTKNSEVHQKMQLFDEFPKVSARV